MLCFPKYSRCYFSVVNCFQMDVIVEFVKQCEDTEIQVAIMRELSTNKDHFNDVEFTKVLECMGRTVSKRNFLTQTIHHLKI